MGLVPFLIVKWDWRVAITPHTHHSLSTSSHHFETADSLSVAERSGKIESLGMNPPPPTALRARAVKLHPWAYKVLNENVVV